MSIILPPLFAHRGCSGMAPENTLAAFQRVLDHDIPGVELDVHLARSGEVVVIHDANLKRVGGVDVEVGEIDYEELRTVDVGSSFGPEFENERVPLLDEVFEMLAPSVFFDIELKARRGEEHALAKAVSDRIKHANMIGRCIVSSFNPLAVRAFRRFLPDVATAVIYARNKALPALLRRGAGCTFTRCTVVKPHWSQTGLLARMWHKGIFRRQMAAWTVNERDVAERLFAHGVDAIISDVPETLIDLIPPSNRPSKG